MNSKETLLRLKKIIKDLADLMRVGKFDQDNLKYLNKTCQTIVTETDKRLEKAGDKK